MDIRWNVQGCLAAFFAREAISWECPAETAAKKRAAAAEGADGLHGSSPLNGGTPPQQLLKRRRWGLRPPRVLSASTEPWVCCLSPLRLLTRQPGLAALARSAVC